MLYWLSLKNNSNQGLCLFRQKEILRSSRHKNLENQNNEVFFWKYKTIYRIKCDADNKTQNFQMWPKPFTKSFKSSSNTSSSLQINQKIENMQAKIYFITDMKVPKSLKFY